LEFFFLMDGSPYRGSWQPAKQRAPKGWCEGEIEA
jgi:hypothetical protein